MKIGALSIAALLVSAVAAQADSFTFTGAVQVNNQVGGMVAGGGLVAAQFSSGENKVTGGGKSWTTKFTCGSWTMPPGGMFSSQGICNASDGANQYTVAFSCQTLDAKSTANDCWGRLTGTSGAYANKVGEVAWHGVGSADPMSATTAGTGMWN